MWRAMAFVCLFVSVSSFPVASTGSQATTTGTSALAIGAELAAKKSPAASVTGKKKRSIKKRRKKSPRMAKPLQHYGVDGSLLSMKASAAPITPPKTA